MQSHPAKYLIFLGLALVVIGVIWYFLGHRLHFLGRLPGDIRVERENFRFYAPITTMILVSLLLSGLLTLIKKFL